MKATIENTIRQLEAERGIRVLYACESGSRAWGFASPDSDYDLRFIYAHPRDWYLQIQKQRDVIDLMLPNDLDLSGWELRKTLRLFATCNLALNEWLGSPEVYWQADGFRDELSVLIRRYFNPRKAVHHYLSQARNTAKASFDGQRIKIKKLFYILRPLFACHWIEQKQAMPPTVFQEMLEGQPVHPELHRVIDLIQAEKAAAVEAHPIETSTIIYDWIHESIHHFESIEDNLPTPNSRPGWDPLNAIMLKWIRGG